jgi:hypothetical protein
MNNEVIHNFCESRMQNENPPEYFNAFSSFFMVLIPLFLGLPKSMYFFYGGCILLFNGFASFYYHYYLNFLGKQADEISMILINYYTLMGLIHLNYKDSISNIKKYNLLNTFFSMCFIIFNTEIYFDFLFPYFFGIYILFLLKFLYKVHQKFEVPMLANLGLSVFGASSWFISELYCNQYTQYFHILWHLLFPLGFYRIILDCDEIYNRETLL